MTQTNGDELTKAGGTFASRNRHKKQGLYVYICIYIYIYKQYY